MVKVILWAGIILLLSYMFHINVTGLLGSVTHAVQTVHNSQP